jgi:hypothetical protein
MFQQDVEEIQAVVTNYFEGIFYGDIKKLESAFHPQCLLFGDMNGQPYLKNLPDYLEGVKNRKSPNELGENFRMNILGIEILNNMAYAKLHVPMLGYNYYDFITLSRISGKWVYINKVFTNVS